MALRGPHFAGMINSLRTYSTHGLEDKAVIFRRGDIWTYTTPLTHSKIHYDNINHPTKLIIQKWCSSAPILDESVVVINI
mgnify:CR=1 FL=1